MEIKEWVFLKKFGIFYGGANVLFFCKRAITNRHGNGGGAAAAPARRFLAAAPVFPKIGYNFFAQAPPFVATRRMPTKALEVRK